MLCHLQVIWHSEICDCFVCVKNIVLYVKLGPHIGLTAILLSEVSSIDALLGLSR
jgi:hypothetical protein